MTKDNLMLVFKALLGAIIYSLSWGFGPILAFSGESWLKVLSGSTLFVFGGVLGLYLSITSLFKIN